MITKDDRTEAQKQTHKRGIVGRDKFLSGWGAAENGYSRAAWAVGPNASIEDVEKWVRSRSDMQYVHVVNLDTYKPRKTAHYHIYVMRDGKFRDADWEVKT